MAFNLEAFLDNPTWEEFDKFRKSDLLKLSDHFQSGAKPAMYKQEIKNILIQALVDENLFDETALDFMKEVKTGINDPIEMKKLEIQMLQVQREMEKERLDQEKELAKVQAEKDKEIEIAKMQLDQKEKELELVKLQTERDKEIAKMQFDKEIELKKLENKSHEKKQGSGFDATKYVKFVPKFDEAEVDKYFLHFEKIAGSLKWPKESWALLIQGSLSGKAREIFTSLSIDDGNNYDKLKEAVLKAYELVPEAYRQKFRNLKKAQDQTHVEFARSKETLLDRWLTAKDVQEDYNNLRQLILVEEFKSCVHSDIKTHLDESKVDTPNQAATIADDYAITHKLSSNSNSKPNYHKKPWQNKSSHSPQSGEKPKSENKTSSKSGDKSDSSSGKSSKSDHSRSSITCTHCKKKGHLVSQCWQLHGKPEGCIVRTRPTNITANVNMVNKPKPVGEVSEEFKPFVISGHVSLTDDNSNPQPIKIMRDTGCAQTLILDDTLPFSDKSSTKSDVLIKGVGMEFAKVPLHQINLKSDLVSGTFTVGIRPHLPIPGVSMLLGNDLAGGKVIPDPIVSTEPCTDNDSEEELDLFPACAVTRAMSKQISQEEMNDVVEKKTTQNQNEQNHQNKPNPEESFPGLEDTFFSQLDSSDEIPSVNDPITKNKLIEEQKKDPKLTEFIQQSLPAQEAEKVPVCFYEEDGVLMRKFRPPDVSAEDEWTIVHQIVVPQVYRAEILSLGHSHPLAGHMGIRRTYDRILSHFWWPSLRKDVTEYCKSCHTCQVVGKPNQTIPKAPLKPIPAFEEPFSRIIIDCVGPLPKTKSGNQYLLTIMCASTRFPEAIPLRNIKAKTIVKALIKFFTQFGLPKSIQSDRGSNFMSGLFQQVMHELGISQFSSSAWHPESQGALERWHQSLKNMMRMYCAEYEKDWDEGVHLLLFAARESVQESLGFSPFELVFGHRVRGPLQLLKEKWLTTDSELNLLDYVSSFKTKLARAGEIARDNLKDSQAKMKRWYDKDARNRVFEKGEKVLVLFPMQGNPLQARYNGPYEVDSKVSDLNYVVKTPDRRKNKQLCHVNMLKKYVDRDENHPKPIAVTISESCDEDNVNKDEVTENSVNPKTCQDMSSDCPPKLSNSEVLENLDTKIGHLDNAKQEELTNLIHDYDNLFSDVPTKTNLVSHDIDVDGSPPIKQHPYRLNPVKTKILKQEVEYMLQNDIIEPSHSDWSSPCILVPKPDGSYRVCQDFRAINRVSKTDSYPIPRIDDCIDKIGHAKFVSKYDMLKGYWGVPLTDRAKEISAFATADGLFQYKVMAFGLKNAGATFQRMVNRVIENVDGCEAYIDDLVLYSDTWIDHMRQMKQLFEELSNANLTVNLAKSDFCCATVTYLGHVVGQGQTKPIQAKVEAIDKFPVPSNRKELMRFLGMAGYYRKYCPNFSVIANPMTSLLKKGQKFIWSQECQDAFEKIKAILMSSPVLAAPDFEKQFKLMVDASDVGCGAVLTQEGIDHVDHPVCFFSKKFDKHQKNYSTIEKECLALLLALQHFEVYVSSPPLPVLVYTDHNPLTFLSKMRNKNQRLLRWSLTMQEYNLDIMHIKGKDNVIADALSRV